MHIKLKNDMGGCKHLVRFWSCGKVVGCALLSVSCCCFVWKCCDRFT